MSTLYIVEVWVGRSMPFVCLPMSSFLLNFLTFHKLGHQNYSTELDLGVTDCGFAVWVKGSKAKITESCMWKYCVAGSCRSREDGSARTPPVYFGAHLSRHTAFRPLSSSSVLLLRTTLNPEIQLAVGFPVELARQTAPQMSLTFLFLCRLVAYPPIAWQKN